MTTSSPKTLARIAGLLYLGTSVPFVFAVQVRSRIIEPADAAATVHNIRASATLFRVGLVADLVSWAVLLAPSLKGVISFLGVGSDGELIFIGWLLVRGARAPRPSGT